jgi:hypothetical protein
VDLLLSVVLDRSGSMDSVRDSTIAGYNELIRSQKNEEGQTYVSLTLFDTKPELRHVMVPLSDAPLLDRGSYVPDGWTALYDAVADSIHAIEAAQERGADLPEKILFVVQTDGHENSSTRHGQKDVFDLVKKKQADGWAFLFLGCAIDAWGIGAQLGIPAGSTMSYTTQTTAQTFSLASTSTSAYRHGSVTYDCLAIPPQPIDPTLHQTSVMDSTNEYTRSE